LKDAVAKGLKTSINPLMLFLPSICDNMSSSLMFIALGFIPASVYQMTRGIIVFITAMMSVIFLKRTLYRHHITALIFIVGGIAVVGVAVMLFKNTDKPDDNDYHMLAGIMIMVVA